MTPFEFIYQTVIFFLMGLSVYYLLVLKPANDRATARQKFVDGLKKNDEVFTSGGLLGRVVAVKQEAITLEIAPNVKVRVLPANIQPLPAMNVEAGEKSEG